MKKHILHTEASNGWGGQEIRILREAIGMRDRGYQISLAVTQGGKLAERARNEGFTVYEFPIDRKHSWSAFWTLRSIIKKEKVDLVNTHSSWDAWLGGVAARSAGCRILRTRHLSTPIRPGWNSHLLYRWLADGVVTTCEQVAEVIRKQAKLSKERCCSIPTGVEPKTLTVSTDEIDAFRKKYQLHPDLVVAGTACVLRSWKGISDLLKAADLLRDNPKLRWLIVGSGPGDEYYQKECKALGLEKQVLFTGHLENPFAAMATMDIFLLLSTANEGVSQAVLQAAYLQKPLITTRTGGLAEVCQDEITGYTVDTESPEKVAEQIKRLIEDKELRKKMGQQAKKLVEKGFTFDKMLDRMEEKVNCMLFFLNSSSQPNG